MSAGLAVTLPKGAPLNDASAPCYINHGAGSTGWSIDRDAPSSADPPKLHPSRVRKREVSD